MAEVGVLSLQIHDNSAKAASELDKLASALERVRSAVGGGKQLSGAATEIEKIKTAVSGAVSGEAAKGFAEVAKKIEAVKKASEGVKLPELKNSDGFITTESKIEEAITNVGESAVTATKKIETFKDSVREMKRTVEGSGVETIYDPAVKDFVPVDRYSGAGAGSAAGEHAYNGPDPVLADVVKRSGFDSIYEAFPGYRQQMENQFPEMYEAMKNAAGGIEELSESGENAGLNIRQLGEALFGAGDDAKGFGDRIKGLFPHLSMLGKQLMSIARRMALRAVIKQVTAGIKEGVENLYWYSKAVGTDFAPAMDSAASAMLQFKNSIGAAAAPVIQALIPVLQTVVNWFITAINYANQFLALITGKSGWTRALPVAADAFEQTGRRARGAGRSAREAAKDVKELLADWDELNIIQSETGGGTGSGGGGGGGAGGTSAEYSSMFQEMRSFNEDIQAFVRNLTNSFGSILELVKKVGAVMLAWKVSSVVGGIVGTLAGLVGAGIMLDITFKLVKAFDKTYADTGNVGWLIGDVLTTLVGATLTSKILSKVLGGAVGKIVLPLTLAVSAGATIKAIVEETDLSELNQRTVVQAVTAGIKGGAAIGLLAYASGAITKLAAIGAGISGTLITFGAAIGIKATSVVAKTGEITKETVMADVAAAVSTALGVSGLALSIGSASLATAAAMGAGALIFTLAATIGIQAIIASKPKAVKWGDYDATEHEIKNFVEGSVFKVNANTILNMINPKIEAVSTEEEGLTAKADEVKLTVSKVLLGFDDKETLKDLEKQILGTGEADDSESLIGRLRKTMKAKNSVIETGLILQFSNLGDGSTEASKEAKNQLGIVSAGWEAIDNEISSLGRSLSASFGRAYREGITEEAKAAEIKTIAELSQMIANVSAAMVKGEAQAQAQINLKDNLSSLSRESFGNILDYIKEYKEQVSNAYITAYDAVIKELGSQAAALEQSWQNELQLAKDAKTESERAEHERNAKAYEAQYKQTYGYYMSQLEGRDAAIKAATEKAMDKSTLELIRNAILGNIQGKAGAENISADFAHAMYASFHDAKATTEQKSGAVKNLINNVIDQYFGEDANTIKGLIEEGILSYKDVIDQGIVEALAGGGIWVSEQDVWQTIIDQIFGNDGKPTEVDGPDVNVGVGVKPEIEEATSEAPTTEEILGGLATEAESNLNATDSVITDHTFPVTNTVDTSATTGATGDMAAQVHSDVMSVASDINWLNSMVGGYGYSGIGGAGRFSNVTGVTVHSRATGGNIRSGELFFGNENGRIEMMGKMGNSAVVANNQQIVEGISKGVATSNAGMESAMNMMVALMRQFVSKEFTAKVVPSSSMGRNNAMSNEAYRKVTG